MTINNNIIPAPSWDGVRPIYKKLSDEFNVLTDAFKLFVDPSTKNNLDHLITVIDDVDQCIDELPDKESRDSITRSLVTYLGDDENNWQHPAASVALIHRIQIIKQILRSENVHLPFIEAAKTIFSVTELKRHTNDISELIDYIKKEGEATALLPLSVLKIEEDEAFGLFFSRLCRLMGIADLVFDARQDYKQGYIQVRPSLKLYVKLIGITISEGIKLILNIPNKLKFLVYCYKFTLALMKG